MFLSLTYCAKDRAAIFAFRANVSKKKKYLSYSSYLCADLSL